MSQLPFFVHWCCRNHRPSTASCRVGIFVLTLLIYASFHASRKPISVVKSVLHPNCTEIAERENKTIVPANATFCMWAPFDTDNYNLVFGYLDLTYLLAYAIGMFISGHVAERMNLRLFLTLGCLFSGLTTAMFGFGFFLNIHSMTYYFSVQAFGGFVQASGWPAVVTCMGNWFGKKRRGLILGLWNSHTSLGNIFGGLLAGAFVEVSWGWSFIAPSFLIGFMGVVVFLLLVPYPEDIDLSKSIGYEELSNAISSRSPSLECDPLLSNSISRVEDEEEVVFQSSEMPSTSIFRENLAAISFYGALKVPGVVEYSLCLFFAKSVSYTFLFWLPKYISDAGGFHATISADLATIFDIGGIMGGIIAGIATDRTSASAVICVVMLIVAMPILFAFYYVGVTSVATCIGMLIPLGILINGPYALITTAVSADLGMHESLRKNAKALATISAIIDGTGSLGAAFGPLFCGLLIDKGWIYIFIMLVMFLGFASLCLSRRAFKEISACRMLHREHQQV